MKVLMLLLLITSGTKKVIVTSVSPLRLIINEMVDTSQVKVINIVPRGQNPHTFDPRPSDVKKIANACAFVYISDIAESWAPKLVKNLPPKNRPRILKVWTLLGRKESIYINPHFWFDPYTVKKLSRILSDSLKDCGAIGSEKFSTRLDSLILWINTELPTLKTRCFIPSHNSWTVFAKAFHIKTTTPLWTTEGTELSPRKIIRIMKQAKKCRTKVLVLDSIYNPDLVTPFRENGFKIVELDPQGWDEVTYTEFMKKNLTKLFEALNEGN